MTPAEFEKKVNAAIEAEDLEALKKLQNEFVDDGETTLPFQPSVRLRGKAGDSAQEGDVGIALANGLSSYRKTIINYDCQEKCTMEQAQSHREHG